MSAWRSRRLLNWLLTAAFAAWALISLVRNGEKWIMWESPLVGWPAVGLAATGLVLGIARRPKPWFLGISLVLVSILAVWRHVKALESLDYMAGAAGLVVDSTGMPVADAAITITYPKNVFSAITPIRVGHTSTGGDGRFNIWFISCGDGHTPFKLRVEKRGFQAVEIRGAGFEKRRLVLRGS